MENCACSRANFSIWGLGGVGWDNIDSSYPAHSSDATLDATCSCHCCFEMRAQHPQKRLQKHLVTDGAPCYPKLTSESNLGHEACNHSKGIFCIKKGEKIWGTLLVHTVGIDGTWWKVSKGAVSSSWSTRKHGAINPQLLQGIRIWQMEISQDTP